MLLAGYRFGEWRVLLVVDIWWLGQWHLDSVSWELVGG